MQRPSQPVMWLAGSLLLASLSLPLYAVVPLPPYPQCGAVADQADQSCPNDFREDWRYLSYIKDDYKNKVRTQEWALGSGFSLDKALQRETGDWRVTIAVLDSGIHWDAQDLVNKHWLNARELPLPRNSTGQTSSTYDLNGDGIFNIQDYAQDARVSLSAGQDRADGLLDPSDLIAVFSDGIDQDGNGYTDDIAGWDFFWNDNNPYDTVRYGHGTFEANDAAAEGGNGLDDMGPCPSCSVLNLRVGDSFITDVNLFAEATLYAADMGASVIQEALGTYNNSVFAQDAIAYANAKGLTVVASNADETSIHANSPANNEGTLVVHAIRYDTNSESSASTFLAMANCTNFGGNLHLSVPGTDCSSEATARAAGIVGLVYSAALKNGLKLTPQEIFQLMNGTADDIDVPETYNDGAPKLYPSQPGWEAYFGYGRVNAYRAVDRVYQRKIPPEVEWTSPEWFQTVDPSRTPVVSLQGRIAASRSSTFSYVVEYAVGLSPLAADFVVLKSGTSASVLNGTLASFDLRTIPLNKLDPLAKVEPLTVEDTHVDRVNKINRYTVTLRVRATDATGNSGEARRTIYVHTDPELLPDFPLSLGSSLESSPKLADLNGDGRDELLQATSDGWVHAFQADGSELSGWPVKSRRFPALDPARVGQHTGAPAYKSGAVSADRGQAFISTLAVGDVDGDGMPEVVGTTLDGDVYAWKKEGTLLTGFPATIDFTKATDALTSENNFLEAGFFSSPALGDLNKDGKLDIVVGGMDQWVYAFNYQGKQLPGWPVQLRYVAGDGTSPNRDRIMVSPALGDLDGNGTLEVVIGTNELIDGNQSPTYAIHADGNLHSGGPFLSGWPILTSGLYGDVLPGVGKGTCSSPALADIDGDGRLEVATHTITGYPTRQSASIYRYNGRPFSRMGQSRRDWGALSNTEEPSGFVTINSGTFGDLDQDGDVDYVLNMGGFNALLNLLQGARRTEHNYLIGAWDARTGISLAGFPQQVADMQFFMNPTMADLDGDSLPEVIHGDGAFMLWAFNRVGEQPAGWPKFTGQWNLSAPAVGDMDGDGFLEVVAGTRGGWLYAWHTTGTTAARGGVVEWSSFHHDLRNSGNYETAAEERMATLELNAARTHTQEGLTEGMGCALSSAGPGSSEGKSTGAGGWLLLGGMVCLVRRRRK
ncbi:MAG: FG-GAP-like repeat-containing protein [Myxococcota bacterium]